MQNFHWLDERFNFVSQDQLSEKKLLSELDVEEKISLLNQRLYSTFVSLEIRTLQLLIRYLEKIHESGSNNIVIGIRKFHYVWEFLLRNIFHNGASYTSNHINHRGCQGKVPKKMDKMGVSPFVQTVAWARCPCHGPAEGDFRSAGNGDIPNYYVCNFFLSSCGFSTNLN